MSWETAPKRFPLYYREAVAASSPTLPRFAATLGRRVRRNFNREAVAAFLGRRNRFAVEFMNGGLDPSGFLGGPPLQTDWAISGAKDVGGN